MVKKLLVGLVVVMGLFAVAGTAFIALKGDATGRAEAESDKASLSQGIEAAFGGQVQVEFVCQFPVVGVAPCVVDSPMDSREIKLTLTDSRPAGDATPDEHALRIAEFAHQTSSFASAADKIEVIFQEGNVLRQYSFTREDLITGAAPAPDRTDTSEQKPRP